MSRSVLATAVCLAGVLACATAETLPAWQASWSDGCSVPAALKPLIMVTAEQRRCCVRHDEAYYYGGPRDARRRADADLRSCLIASGMDVALADVFHAGVRVGGEPEYRMRGVSWAFGGERFRYSKHPAKPEPGDGR